VTVNPLSDAVTTVPCTEQAEKEAAKAEASVLAVLDDPQLSTTVFTGAPPLTDPGQTKMMNWPVWPLCSVPEKVTEFAVGFEMPDCPPKYEELITGVMAAPEVEMENEYCGNDQLWPSAYALMA
jgi:hypothetical protein